MCHQPHGKSSFIKSLLLFIAVQCVASAPVFSADMYAAAREELIQLRKEDQAIRQKGNLTPADIIEMRAIDLRTSERLKEIIKQIGWPTTATVGKDASSAAFLIAQHAAHDRPLMDLAFSNIEAGYKAGTVPGVHYALMYDRLKMFDGLPQKYGTQIQSDAKSCEVYKLEDPAKVDTYRREVGLMMDLESYKNKLCGG
ncbi:MAG: DUF6624 domain-containing protein [Pseudomonadota bacterium]